MSILTGRDLEFLDSLRTSWPRLYWNELARLQKEDDEPREAQFEAQVEAEVEAHAKGLHSGLDGKILAFALRRPHRMISE
jgi:hypothetical protein